MFDRIASLRTAAEALGREFSADDLSASDAVRVVEALGVVSRIVSGLVAKSAKRADDLEAHRLHGARSTASLLGKALGVPVGEARSLIDTATKLERLPHAGAAVQAGNLSARQAEMIANAAEVNPEAERRLLAAAERGLPTLKDACVAARAEAEDPVERSRRHRRQRSWRTWTDPDGMGVAQLRLPPEQFAKVKARVDAEVQKIFRSKRKGRDHEPLDAYAADAVTEFVLADRAQPDTNRKARRGAVEARVHVLIDHDALVRGNVLPGEVCEIPGVGPVNVDWVRSLIGSSFLTAVVKKGKDILSVAHLGRYVPAELQTALVVRGHTCSVKGCGLRGYLERDHTVEYRSGGPTAYWNLRWLCYVHHQLKTAGWILGPPDPDTGECELRPPKSRAA